MTSDIKKNVTTYQAQRVTLTSPEPLKATLAALMEELNKDKAGLVVFEIMAKSRTKEEIETRMGELTEGKRDFVLFAVAPHSRWLSKFHDNIPESYQITLGNPLIAQTFVPFDTRAGLYVPLRILLEATSEGGTAAFYDLPSSQIIVEESSPQEMKTAAYELDAKLERMLTRVLKNTQSRL